MSIKQARRSAGRRSGMLAATATAVMLAGGLAAPPARADNFAWEQGCAYKMPSGTPGTGLTQYFVFCDRAKACQTMADARGHVMMEVGCFFFEPRARPAGRLRAGG